MDKALRFRVRTWVRADTNLVFAWFDDPDRWAEQREFFERFETAEFQWEERAETGVHGVVASWTTRSGIAIDLRITDWSEPERLTRHVNISQARMHPGGREDRSDAQSIIEFRPDPNFGTRVLMSVDVARHHYRWWALSPIARHREHRHRSRHLRESVGKCGAAIESGYQGSSVS